MFNKQNKILHQFCHVFVLSLWMLVASCSDKSDVVRNKKSSVVYEGLFVVSENKPVEKYIENGFVVTKASLDRVNIEKISLRNDDENAGVFWVEINLDRTLDAGDEYFFHLDGKDHTGFKNRGERWVLKFESLKEGRSFLKKLVRVYDLSEGNWTDDAQK